MTFKDWISVATAGFRVIARHTWAYFAWCAIASLIFFGGGALLSFAALTLSRGGLAPGAMVYAPEAMILILPGLLAPVTCAVYRAVFEPEAGGFALLRVGPQEMRVAWVSLLLGLFWAGVAASITALSRGGDPAAYLVLALAVGASALLSLLGPAAYARSRLDVRAAVDLAVKNFPGLLALSVLSWCVYAGGFLAYTLGWGRLMGALLRFDNPIRSQPFVDLFFLQSLHLTLGCVLAPTAAVLVLAAGAEAYARLAPADDTDPAVFA